MKRKRKKILWDRKKIPKGTEKTMRFNTLNTLGRPKGKIRISITLGKNLFIIRTTFWDCIKRKPEVCCSSNVFQILDYSKWNKNLILTLLNLKKAL